MKTKLLRFHEYNKEWPKEFEKIKVFLDSKLLNLITNIHHVGSTSVVGLGAKPILDIDIEYKNHLQEIITILENNNYIYEGEKGIKGRHSFRQIKPLFYEHHLYVIHYDCEELQKHITFRNALRSSEKFKMDYHNLKQNLIKENNQNRELYTNSKTQLIKKIMEDYNKMKTIVFAGGCFWGVEAYFKQIKGVIDTEVGYIAGQGETSYKEVCAGSGHAEAVQISYTEEVSLNKLLDHLFNIIDPTSINKQGPDIGVQYRTGIYNYNNQELDLIKAYINVRQKEYKKPIALELLTNQTFFKAEDYHQDYLDKNKNGYCHVNLESHKNVE